MKLKGFFEKMRNRFFVCYFMLMSFENHNDNNKIYTMMIKAFKDVLQSNVIIMKLFIVYVLIISLLSVFLKFTSRLV